jgi:hypothetical protein
VVPIAMLVLGLSLLGIIILAAGFLFGVIPY